MLDYVYGHDAVVARFVADLIPHCRRGFPETARAIGVIDADGGLIAGLVYHNYDPEAEAIEISGAALPGKHWLTRGTIARMYQYPFLGIGCQMVFQRTPATDERLLGMLAAYDYTFVKVPRMFGRERDGVLCLLTVEAWQNNRFNKRLRHHEVPDAPQQQEAA
jgi:hypothetical protein